MMRSPDRPRCATLLALAVFAYAYAGVPVLEPECLAHGFGDGSMAHAVELEPRGASGDGSHDAEHRTHQHHADSSPPSGGWLCFNVCLCEYSKAALGLAAYGGPVAPLASSPGSPCPGPVLIPRPFFWIPPATGPPAGI